MISFKQCINNICGERDFIIFFSLNKTQKSYVSFTEFKGKDTVFFLTNILYCENSDWLLSFLIFWVEFFISSKGTVYKIRKYDFINKYDYINYIMCTIINKYNYIIMCLNKSIWFQEIKSYFKLYFFIH